MAKGSERMSGGGEGEGMATRRSSALETERSRRAPVADTVAQAVTGLSQGMNALIRGHLSLARVEMTRDLKALGKSAAMDFGGAAMLFVGYVLLWTAIGLLIGLKLAAWASFLICAGANFLGGAVLIARGRARMKKAGLSLPDTSREVQRDRAWLSSLKQPLEVGPEPERAH